MLFIFDMGGVVTTNFGRGKMREWLGLSSEDFRKLQYDFDENLYSLLEVGRFTVPQFWQAIQKNAVKKGIDIPPVDFNFFRFTFHPKLNEKTVEIIKKLRKNHRVVCGTNTIDPHWENHMERGDYSYFDQTYASNKIGCAKPDPHFFELILEAEQTAPEDAFFTDDRADNVAAAASLGIHAELFTSAAELTEKWKQFC